MNSKFFSATLWMLFAIAVAACIGASHSSLTGGTEHLATYGGLALTLITGPLLARQEPVRSWLQMRAVNWFLFLFNLAAAVTLFVAVGGPTGIGAGIGMGIVSLGAGVGLIRNRRTRARESSRVPLAID